MADLQDQYGIKPASCTTAAMINIIAAIVHCITDSNKYVRCTLIDMSKAFDSVNQQILIDKFKNMLSEQIINWAVIISHRKDAVHHDW